MLLPWTYSNAWYVCMHACMCMYVCINVCTATRDSVKAFENDDTHVVHYCTCMYVYIHIFPLIEYPVPTFKCWWWRSLHWFRSWHTSMCICIYTYIYIHIHMDCLLLNIRTELAGRVGAGSGAGTHACVCTYIEVYTSLIVTCPVQNLQVLWPVQELLLG